MRLIAIIDPSHSHQGRLFVSSAQPDACTDGATGHVGALSMNHDGLAQPILFSRGDRVMIQRSSTSKSARFSGGQSGIIPHGAGDVVV
jgi:hypothetical protein